MQWRDDTTLPTAALRDFRPVYDRYGSSATGRYASGGPAMSASPRKRTHDRRCDMSASCQNRTHAPQQATRMWAWVLSDWGGPGHTPMHVRFGPKATVGNPNTIRRFVPGADLSRPLSRSRPRPGSGRGRWLPPRSWEYVTRGPHT